MDWLKGLCSSLEETGSSAVETTSVASVNLKKDVVSRTVRSLIELYEISNHNSVAQRFGRLANGLLWISCFIPFVIPICCINKSTVEQEVSTFLGLTGFMDFFKTFASGYTCGVWWINGGIKWSLHDEELYVGIWFYVWLILSIVRLSMVWKILNISVLFFNFWGRILFYTRCSQIGTFHVTSRDSHRD